MTEPRNHHANPPVDEHGADPAVPRLTAMPDFTPEDMAKAEADLRLAWQLELDDVARTATLGAYGMPATRGPGYYSARAYLLQCLLFPVRYVVGGDLEGLPPSLEPSTMLMLPEHDEPAPGTVGVPLLDMPMLEDQPHQLLPFKLPTQYRCPSCRCSVPRDHVPDSDECREDALERSRCQAD